MKSSTWIGKKGFRYWYYKYRDSEYYALGIIALTIVVSILLIFYFIVPEINQWFSIRNEITATQQRISVLQDNITFLTNLDGNVLNSQLQTASQALPPNKDVGNILDTIANASVTSGIALSEYNFPVGDISSNSASVATNDTTNANANGVSTLTISLTVNGTVDQLRQFINAIENSLPLADVTTIDENNGAVALTMVFYQKPFPSIDTSGNVPLAPLSAERKSLLLKLAQWGSSNSAGLVNTIQSSSPSASSIPLF